LRWGLIPSWAKDPKIAYKTINARVETVDTASYRQAFKKRRCLITVGSFYEWKKVWQECEHGGVQRSLTQVRPDP